MYEGSATTRQWDPRTWRRVQDRIDWKWPRQRIPEVQMMTYPLLIRPDVWARAILPDDLTEREAERFAAMVKTLAFSDEELAS